MIESVPPVILLDMLKKEKERRLAETSVYEFTRQAWHVIEPGKPFIDSWHLQTLSEHLEAVTKRQIFRLLANVPPRHTKSILTGVTWPMWEWIELPQEQFLCASYAGPLAIRDNLKARRLITSPWFQDRWGDRFKLSGDQNAKQRFENDHTGYRIATSVGGTATGEGGSRLVLDDPHSAQEAQSEALRETALEWFDMVWSTRLNNPKTDAMVVIMQRLHELDISGHIINDLGDWEHICIPAEYDGVKRKTSLGYYDPRKDIGELICPDRFGRKEIEKLKKLLGDYGSAGQLQQDPNPPGGGILKTRHFQLWPYDESLPQFQFVLQSYDCAYTEDSDNDPNACTVWGLFQHEGTKQMMLIDAWDEYLEYPKLRKRVIRDWKLRYGGSGSGEEKTFYTRGKRPDRILVEKKASGQSLLQDLRIANVPAIGYNPGNADKIARAHMASPTLELDIIWVPESKTNPGHHVTWASEFMKQLTKFPVAVHDDYVDTFTQAVIYFKDSGLLDLPRAEDDEEEPRKKRNTENPYAA